MYKLEIIISFMDETLMTASMRANISDLKEGPEPFV